MKLKKKFFYGIQINLIYYTALHIACDKGYFDIVRLLLQKHFIKINCKSIH